MMTATTRKTSFENKRLWSCDHFGIIPSCSPFYNVGKLLHCCVIIVIMIIFSDSTNQILQLVELLSMLKLPINSTTKWELFLQLQTCYMYGYPGVSFCLRSWFSQGSYVLNNHFTLKIHNFFFWIRLKVRKMRWCALKVSKEYTKMYFEVWWKLM